jgi:hypothetical protein
VSSNTSFARTWKVPHTFLVRRIRVYQTAIRIILVWRASAWAPCPLVWPR